MVYQENSLAGFKSLLDLNVDAFETDIFLTKDKKLVLFHTDNPLVCIFVLLLLCILLLGTFVTMTMLLFNQAVTSLL